MEKNKKVEMEPIKKKYDNIFNYFIAITCSILLIICIIGYNFSINIHYEISDEEEEQIEKKEYKKIEISSQLFSVEDYPNVLCTNSTFSMAEKLMANFTRQDESKLTINVLDEDTAYKKLIEGEADVILVNNLLTNEIQKANKLGIKLDSFKVANDGIVFLTNKDNTINSLNLKQIQKIYNTSDKLNWNEFGGSDEEIIVCNRIKESETQRGMISSVMQGLELNQSLSEHIISDNSTLYNVIADSKNNEGAIGYTYFKNTLYNEDVKLLRVNDVTPNYDTIKNEVYPIKTGYYAIIKKNDEKKKNISKFIENIKSVRGKKIIEDAGYIAPID